MRGFTFRPRLFPDDGLIIVGNWDSRLESSITMLFVTFDLAVIWINSDMHIVDKVIAKSWQPAYFSKKPARFVLEVHPDRWEDYEVGDILSFEDI